MLSGEGNKNGEKKTTIGLISRKSTLHEHHTFFVHFFAVVLHDYSVKLPETSRNFLVTHFMEEMSHVFVFNFFPLLLIFTLVAASVLTNATKCSCCSSNRNFSFVFSISPQIFFSLSFAGLSPYFLFFSVFLFLSFPNLWA